MTKHFVCHETFNISSHLFKRDQFFQMTGAAIWTLHMRIVLITRQLKQDEEVKDPEGIPRYCLLPATLRQEAMSKNLWAWVKRPVK